MSHREKISDYYDEIYGLELVIIYELSGMRYLILDSQLGRKDEKIEAALDRIMMSLSKDDLALSLRRNPMLVSTTIDPVNTMKVLDLGIPKDSQYFPTYEWGKWPDNWLDGSELEQIKIPRNLHKVERCFVGIKLESDVPRLRAKDQHPVAVKLPVFSKKKVIRKLSNEFDYWIKLDQLAEALAESRDGLFSLDLSDLLRDITKLNRS